MLICFYCFYVITIIIIIDYIIFYLLRKRRFLRSRFPARPRIDSIAHSTHTSAAILYGYCPLDGLAPTVGLYHWLSRLVRPMMIQLRWALNRKTGMNSVADKIIPLSRYPSRRSRTLQGTYRDCFIRHFPPIASAFSSILNVSYSLKTVSYISGIYIHQWGWPVMLGRTDDTSDFMFQYFTHDRRCARNGG